MDNESLQRMIKDRNDITTEKLQDIQEQERGIDPALEQRVVKVLEEHGSLSRRQLSRVTRLKRATVDAIVKSLVGRDLVRMVTVSNSTGGRPTVYVSRVGDEEMRQRRLKAMYKLSV